jgi:hypothetical protein
MFYLTEWSTIARSILPTQKAEISGDKISLSIINSTVAMMGVEMGHLHPPSLDCL